MDISKEQKTPVLRQNANPFSLLFFTYTIKMFVRGYKKNLDVEDLFSILDSDRSQKLGDRLERKWNEHFEREKKKKRPRTPSLMSVLIATFWTEFLLLGVILVIVEWGVRMAQPFLLGFLLDYFRPDSTVTREQAFWYAGGLVLTYLSNALMMNQYMMEAFHYGMKLRTACCALIYRKALRLNKSVLAGTATGKIVNLLSNDVSRFDMVSILIHYMWVAPVSAVMVTYFLYREAGFPGLIGIAPLFVIVPLQSYTGKLSAIYRKRTAMKTDERVRLMDEVISGVQVIKMYAWERPFTKLVNWARKVEIDVVTKSSYVRGVFMTFNLFTTRLALFCTFLALVFMDPGKITAAKVFVFMSFYNMLSQTMSTVFVRGIQELAEALVAVKRLQQFMLNEEFVPKGYLQVTNGLHNGAKPPKSSIAIDHLTAKWNAASTEDNLKDLHLDVQKNKLLAVIGPVGCGKSSFLQTILGELEITAGSIQVNGSISYASQDAWVFAATVRQNILFGSEFNRKRYNEVVHVCALEKDFKQFPEGDLTIVGDRGASLSGGQKARINLARAIYRDADIYLLDDPLSAVDIHVSKHLYEECINGYLAQKTRILVTHQVHLLKNADEIIILNNGGVENRGTFQELSSSDSIYAKLLTTEPEAPAEERTKEVKSARKTSFRSRASSITSTISLVSVTESLIEDLKEPEAEVNMKDLQEESSKGKIRGVLLFKYLSYGGNFCFMLFVIVLYLVTQFVASAVDYFVSFWTNLEEARATAPVALSTETCLIIYGSLVAALFVFAITRSMLFYKLAMISSQGLHDDLFNSVIRAPMRFFDTNPSGRILNRFSKDLGAVDELLPKCILDASQMILQMVGSMLLIVTVNPYFLILVVIVGCLFFLLRVIFLKSSQNIKRLEGMMRSPVFTHLNATLQGLTTIRAFQAQDILQEEFDKHQNLHSSAWFMFITASSAFGFYLDLLCFILVALITFSFLIFGETFGLTGGAVGLAITQSTSLTGLLQWGMRQSAEVANQLMSVERVMEYSQLPQEIQPEKPKIPPKNWPNRGEIILKDVGMRYDETKSLILKDLDLVIQPREKVGIVGRTGAGKSSLISALFRLANVVGKVEIDDIDTKDLELQVLRSKISIIPQDPVLFSGTLRYNLDPFGDYKDEALYKALEEVELKDPSNTINRLDNRVMDRGSNYSVGQRQLICLARAIIRQNKILLLDEATANVDPQTDAVIQKTIRQKFADCTVLTVAHRLNTIMDSDKVLVMENGSMVEFDHPHLLLQNPNGRFCKMVAETGRALAEQLNKIAKESYQRLRAVPE